MTRGSNTRAVVVYGHLRTPDPYHDPLLLRAHCCAPTAAAAVAAAAASGSGWLCCCYSLLLLLLLPPLPQASTIFGAIGFIIST